MRFQYETSTTSGISFRQRPKAHSKQHTGVNRRADDPIQQARAAGFEAAGEILALCIAAGKQEQAGEFLRAKLSPEETRLALEFGRPRPWSEVIAGVSGVKLGSRA